MEEAEKVDDTGSDENNEASEEISDSMSEDSSDDEINESRLEDIQALEEQVEQNVYNYEPHVSLIKLLQAEGDLERLRKARERMSRAFPLTEELWLCWIRDEIKVAFTDEEKQVVIELFERAVKDYLSVDIWLEYGQFCIGLIGMEDGIARCREVFDRALTAAGLHVAKGSILWEAYREFETAMLSTLKASSSDVLTAEEQEKLDQQTSRIMNLFKRQLSIPLLDMERTYEELKNFTSSDIDSNITFGYQKATSKLAKIMPFEVRLLSDDPPHLETYLEYLEFEKGEGDPARIQCLFERALVDNCLVPDVWNKYICYLESQLKIGTVVLPVCERSVKNCPWSLILWQRYLRAVERYQEPIARIKEVAEKALAAGFTVADEFRELWMTYLEYLRRQISWNEEHAEKLQTLRATFERAYNHLTESFGLDGDPNCIILQYWARIEAKYCKNMEKAREIWNDIMQLGHAKSAQMWLLFIELERACGDAKHLRKLFSRALQGTSDWPESIGEAWLNFERDEGSIEQWDIAVDKYEKRMKVIQERRSKETEQQDLQEKFQKSKSGGKKGVKALSGEVKGDQKPSTSIRNKRKLEEVGHGLSQKSDLESGTFKRPFPPVAKGVPESSDAESPAPKKTKISSTVEPRGIKPPTFKPSHKERTVFLSNLAYDADEDKIKEIFAEVGEITDFRLVKDYRGRSKGYCYVEYASWDLALEALKKDRVPINGRPIFVSKCEEKQGTPKFKYNTGLEKNKLFVKGLPFSTTQEELKDIFGTYGEVRDVRLVTYRNGHSKGLAFVEYKDETAAAAAVLKMDGMTIGSQVISVAISNPPQRRDREQSRDSLLASLGSGAKEFGPRGKGRTQVSMVPRALARSQMTAATSEATNGGQEKSHMSNADFRNMFLRK